MNQSAQIDYVIVRDDAAGGWAFRKDGRPDDGADAPRPLKDIIAHLRELAARDGGVPDIAEVVVAHVRSAANEYCPLSGHRVRGESAFDTTSVVNGYRIPTKRGDFEAQVQIGRRHSVHPA